MKTFFAQTLSIEKLSSKGFGTGSVRKNPASSGVRAVVPGSLPGEEVVAEFGPRRQGAYIGKLLEIAKPSKQRVALRCKHASVCGGCSLQQMAYPAQSAHKESIVKELFSFVSESAFLPIISMEDPWRYRNKMEYTFSQDKEGKRFLGLMKAASKGRVETVSECLLCPDWFNTALQATLLWWEQSKTAAYHPFTDSGSLRTLTIREGKRTQDKMVMLTVSGRAEFALTKEELVSFSSHIRKALGEEEFARLSLFVRIHQAIAGKPTQFYEMKLSGPDHIREELTIRVGDYTKTYSFLISPTAFFQPNTIQAERIYSTALEMTGLAKKKLVLDLYAGTSTLGIIAAAFAEEVISVELNPYAVFDAASNKESNGVDNLRIIQGDVGTVLADLQKQGTFSEGLDLVLVDPPRTGLGKEASDILLRLQPKEILYISCSPVSQAEDCKKLTEAGYEIVAVRPVDQFPHTVHVENIVLLKRK